MNQTDSRRGGIGFLEALALLFIALKLTGVIGWSWLWVLTPLWIPAAIVVGILLVAGAIFLVAWLLEGPERRHRRKLGKQIMNYGRQTTRKRRY